VQKLRPQHTEKKRYAAESELASSTLRQLFNRAKITAAAHREKKIRRGEAVLK